MIPNTDLRLLPHCPYGTPVREPGAICEPSCACARCTSLRRMLLRLLHLDPAVRERQSELEAGQ